MWFGSRLQPVTFSFVHSHSKRSESYPPPTTTETSHQNDFFLPAAGKPKFSQTTQQITAREDQSVALSCGATGFPPAVVTWEPSDLVSDPRFQIHGQDLVISDVKLADNGQIKCTATNALGTSEKIFDIHVLRE